MMTGIAAVFSGWVLVNIVAPVTLPLVGLFALRLLPLPDRHEGLAFMSTVKDGQLCWAAIAMGVSTIYELWTATESHRATPAWGGFVLAGIIVTMLPAMLLAAGGAVFSTPLIGADVGGGAAWIKHYRVFVGSLAMTTFTAALYTSLHFAINEV